MQIANLFTLLTQQYQAYLESIRRRKIAKMHALRFLTIFVLFDNQIFTLFTKRKALRFTIKLFHLNSRYKPDHSLPASSVGRALDS